MFDPARFGPIQNGPVTWQSLGFDPSIANLPPDMQLNMVQQRYGFMPLDNPDMPWMQRGGASQGNVNGGGNPLPAGDMRFNLSQINNANYNPANYGAINPTPAGGYQNPDWRAGSLSGQQMVQRFQQMTGLLGDQSPDAVLQHLNTVSPTDLESVKTQYGQEAYDLANQIINQYRRGSYQPPVTTPSSNVPPPTNNSGNTAVSVNAGSLGKTTLGNIGQPSNQSAYASGSGMTNSTANILNNQYNAATNTTGTQQTRPSFNNNPMSGMMGNNNGLRSPSYFKSQGWGWS